MTWLSLLPFSFIIVLCVLDPGSPREAGSISKPPSTLLNCHLTPSWWTLPPETWTSAGETCHKCFCYSLPPGASDWLADGLGTVCQCIGFFRPRNVLSGAYFDFCHVVASVLPSRPVSVMFTCSVSGYLQNFAFSSNSGRKGMTPFQIEMEILLAFPISSSGSQSGGNHQSCLPLNAYFPFPPLYKHNKCMPS